ncbi:MAG: TrmB family transcriptional regulator [Candidatus Peregrinibacteria bacterium Greene0416_19]|nr:MAG: TrmB family transcriptional regulator [Candidatus Peregrinibacteria bacterium Greene0416_19]
MNTDLLLELGLKRNEAKIYEALLKYGGSGVSTIALRSKIDRRTVYDTLRKLVDKGLVYEIFGQKETTYEAVDPTKLLELAQEKVHKLETAMPGFLSAYQKHLTPERAYLYKGIEGVKNYIRLMLQTGEDIYTLGGKGAWLDPRLQMFVEWFLKEAKKKGIKLHNIYDYEVQKSMPHGPPTLSAKYKFLPKEASSSGAMDVFGEYVVTFSGMEVGTMSDDLTIFVIASPNLAESYRKWWKVLWDSLPDVQRRN